MSWTKRQFIERALSKIGLNKRDYDPEGEEITDALIDLDMMMLTWEEKNISFGWPIPLNPQNTNLDVDARLDAETYAPGRAVEAIILNLACRIAPEYGKTPMPMVVTGADKTYRALLAHYNKPRRISRNRPLAGEGNRRNRFGLSYGSSGRRRLFLRERKRKELDAPHKPLEFNND